MKIYEATELLKTGKISPQELAKSVFDNIEKKNSQINAYITLCDDSKKIGENITQSPLWGIPIALKDNICTKGVLTTAGSRMLSDFVPPYDATVVEKLKKSGAVIIGKTNMDEFGMGSESKHSFFGEVSNPVNTDFVPGGSSGGSCAAVKSGMALGALGSDTGGSIRQPAAFCGLYALRPTYSLVSRYGLIAFASSFDTIGPVGQSAKDCAIILDAICGFDTKDATSARHDRGDYFKNINPDIRNVKIGIPREYFENTDEDVKKTVLAAAKCYEDMGAVVEECSISSLKYVVSTYYIISSAEDSSNLARFDGVRFGKRCDEYKSIEEMYTKTRSENFGDEVKRRILLGTAVLSKGYYDMYYLKAKSAQKLIKEEFNKLFEKYDVLLTPVSPVRVWKKHAKNDIAEVYNNDICTASVSIAGLPAISVPAGYDKNNMPVGMQLIGKRFAEQMLLNMAFAFEEGGYANGI